MNGSDDKSIGCLLVLMAWFLMWLFWGPPARPRPRERLLFDPFRTPRRPGLAPRRRFDLLLGERHEFLPGRMEESARRNSALRANEFGELDE